MSIEGKYQFRIQQRSGSFSLEPEGIETIAKRIVLGEDFAIELRKFLEGDEIEARHKDDWKDWREFSEVVEYMNKVKSSSKYDFVSPRLQGYIPIEEIRLVREFLDESESLIFSKKTNSWERLSDFWELEKNTQSNNTYNKESQSDDIAGLSGQFLVPNETLLRLDQIVYYLVGDPKDYKLGEDFIRSFFDTLLTNLKDQERIHFPKLGSFQLKEKSSYTRMFVRRKKKKLNNWWGAYSTYNYVKKENPTPNFVTYPTRKVLCFRPAKNLKALLKHDGYEKSIQHQIFTGEQGASKNALLWSQQNGKLSVRRDFAKKIAQSVQIPLPQSAALLNRWLTLLGRCLAQDNVIETDEFGSIFTEWHREHEKTGFDGKKHTIARHRRVYFVLSKQLQEKHGLIEQ